MLEKIESEVWGKIKKNRIRPRGKLFFYWRRLLAVFLVLIFLFLGGAAGSLLITILRYGDWDIYGRLSDSFLVFVFLVFPYLWLFLLLLFIFIILKSFRRLKYGYRRRFFSLLGVSLLLVFLLSFLFYRLGWAKNLENFLADHFSAYSRLNNMRAIWLRPQDGLIAGTIVQKTGDILIIKDLDNTIITIDIGRAKIGANISLSPGEKIKIIGSLSAPQNFLAIEIRPWHCGCLKCLSETGDSCSACRAGSCGQSAGSCSMKENR